MTKIIKCTCKSKFQDEQYGQGKRIGNLTKAGTEKSPVYRCTVCGKEKS